MQHLLQSLQLLLWFWDYKMEVLILQQRLLLNCSSYPFISSWFILNNDLPYNCNSNGSFYGWSGRKRKFRAIEMWQILAIILQGVRIAIPAAALCIVPATVVTSALNQMPPWLSGGMAVGGGMVAAVGYAMVINMMSSKETWPFFAIGFVLAAIGQLTLIALGVIGVALALIYLGLKENSDGHGGSGGTGDPLGDILNDY